MAESGGPETTQRAPRPLRWLESGFEWGLLLSRLLVLIPVIVLVISAAASFIYDSALFIRYTKETIGHPFPVGNRIGHLLLVVDLFLVGATLLIAAIGFYELFISRVDVGGRRTSMPEWLVMHDLNDLKARVVSMLVLVTAVSFVDVVVDFEFHGSGHDILFVGIAVALVIAALTAFLRFGASGHEGS
jgi:uncharacterized membrane protein YqhA